MSQTPTVFAGLNKIEKKIYASLLSIGAQTKAELKFSTGIEDIEHDLDDLINKQLVFLVEGVPQVFVPIPPFKKMRETANNVILNIEGLENREISRSKENLKKLKNDLSSLLGDLSENISTRLKQNKEIEGRIPSDIRDQLDLLGEKINGIVEKNLEETQGTISRYGNEIETSLSGLEVQSTDIVKEAYSQLRIHQVEAQRSVENAIKTFGKVSKGILTSTQEQAIDLQELISNQTGVLQKLISDDVEAISSSVHQLIKELDQSLGEDLETRKKNKEKILNTIRKKLLEGFKTQLKEQIEETMKTSSTALSSRIDKAREEAKALLRQATELLEQDLRGEMELFLEAVNNTSGELKDKLTTSEDGVSKVATDIDNKITTYSENLKETVKDYFTGALQLIGKDARSIEEFSQEALLSLKETTNQELVDIFQDVSDVSEQIHEVLSESHLHINGETASWLKSVEVIRQTFSEISKMLDLRVTGSKEEIQTSMDNGIIKLTKQVDRLISSTSEKMLSMKSHILEELTHTLDQGKESSENSFKTFITKAIEFEEHVRTSGENYSDQLFKRMSKTGNTYNKEITSVIEKLSQIADSLLEELEGTRSRLEVEHFSMIAESESDISDRVLALKKEIMGSTSHNKTSTIGYIETVDNQLGRALDSALTTISDAFEDIKSSISSLTSHQVEEISTSFDEHQEGFSTLIGRFSDTTGETLSHFKSSISSAIKTQENSFEDHLKKEKQTVLELLETNGKHFASLNDQTLSDLDQFISEIKVEASSKVKEVANEIDKHREATQEAYEQVDSDSRHILETLVELDSALRSDMTRSREEVETTIRRIQEDIEKLTEKTLTEAANKIITSSGPIVDKIELTAWNAKENATTGKQRVLENQSKVNELIDGISEKHQSALDILVKDSLENLRANIEETVAKTKDSTGVVEEEISTKTHELTSSLKTSLVESSKTIVEDLQRTTGMLAEESSSFTQMIQEKSNNFVDQFEKDYSQKLLDKTIQTLDSHKDVIDQNLTKFMEGYGVNLENSFMEAEENIRGVVSLLDASYEEISQKSAEYIGKIDFQVTKTINEADALVSKRLKELESPQLESIQKITQEMKNKIQEFTSTASTIGSTIVEAQINSGEKIQSDLSNFVENQKTALEQQSETLSTTLKTIEDDFTKTFKSVAGVLEEENQQTLHTVSSGITEVCSATETTLTESDQIVQEFIDDLLETSSERSKELQEEMLGLAKEIIAGTMEASKIIEAIEEEIGDLRLREIGTTRFLITQADRETFVKAFIQTATNSLFIVAPSLQVIPPELIKEVPPETRVRFVASLDINKAEDLKWIRNVYKNLNVTVYNSEEENLPFLLIRDQQEALLGTPSGEEHVVTFISQSPSFLQFQKNILSPLILKKSQSVSRKVISSRR